MHDKKFLRPCMMHPHMGINVWVQNLNSKMFILPSNFSNALVPVGSLLACNIRPFLLIPEQTERTVKQKEKKKEDGSMELT